VNTPSAKADGFSANAGVRNLYVCDRRPVPGPIKNHVTTDIIPTSRQTASGTRVPAILQSLCHSRSAGASLRSATGINHHQFTPSIFRFVREVAQELRPSGIVNGFRQHSAGKSLHIQIFDGDQTEPINDLPAQFVLEVGTLIRGSSVRLLEQHDGFTSPIASLVWAAGDAALCNPELGLSGAVPARVLDIGSVRENSKAGESNVDSHGIGRFGKRRGRALNTETDEPLSGLPFDRDRLDRSLDWAVQLDLNYVQRPGFAACRH